jgi:hypothetical protein
MFEGLAEVSLEPLLYEAGGVIFASALMGFAHTMRRLLYITGGSRAWLLPYLGAILMLVAAGLHAYASFLLLPAAATEPAALLAVYRFRFIALLAMLSSSIVTVGGALLLWVRFAGQRSGPK